MVLPPSRSTDGSHNCHADRNGLAPPPVTAVSQTDDRVIMASEPGVLPVDPASVKERRRAAARKNVWGHGKGRIISDDELKNKFCQKPMGKWLNKYKIRLKNCRSPGSCLPT